MPVGYARLNYDYSNITEAESLIEKATATAGPIAKQEGGSWSGGAQLFWTPQEKDQTLTLPFTVAQAGTYEVVVIATHSGDYGIFQYELDGSPLGMPIDQFSASDTTEEKLLPERAFTSGEHTLTIRNVGKNAESKGVFFGLDGFLLQKRS